MPNRKLKEIMADLAQARAAYRDAQEYVRSLYKDVGTYREELEITLREIGLKTASSEDGSFTAFFSKRTNANVFDPNATREWLEQNGHMVNDYFRPDTMRIGMIAKGALKETGEIVPGVELITTESLSLRDNTKDKKAEPGDDSQK